MSTVVPLAESEVIRRIKAHIRDVHGSQRAFARSMKVSDAYVSAVINGKVKLPSKWLGLIGCSRLIDVQYFGSFA